MIEDRKPDKNRPAIALRGGPGYADGDQASEGDSRSIVMRPAMPERLTLFILFVFLYAVIDPCLRAGEHSVDDAGQKASHGFDRLGCSSPGSQRTETGSEVAVAVQ